MNAAHRICVMGAGAIGTMVAARLALAGNEVTVVARGARLQDIAANGLRMRGADGTSHTVRVHARAAGDVGPQDIVFIALKSGDLPAALPDLLRFVGPRTLLVPLINGIPWWYRQPHAAAPITAVDPEGALAAAFDPQRVVGSVVFLTSALAADGAIDVRGAERLILGPAVSGEIAGTGTVAALFEDTPIEARTVSDLRPELWAKVALNLATNPLSVVADATLEQQFHSPSLRPVVISALEEAIRVARAHGIEPSLTLEQMLEIGGRAGPFYTSMAQDYRRGTPLELGAICQSVFVLAEEAGVAMPVARLIHDLCRFRAGQG